MKDLFGLVVCGGKSSRMGRDKCFLNYHGIPQWLYIYNLLQPLCQKVLVSCRNSQVPLFPANVESIFDAELFADIGPMAALLSAIEKYPGFSFLIVGCDYPFINQQDLQLLVNARCNTEKAVSFFNKSRGSYEPLIALYESESFDALQMSFQIKNYSLRVFLEEINAAKVKPSLTKSILSVDTFVEYENVRKELKV